MKVIKNRLRRTMLFIPGNNPGMLRDCHIYGADCIMLDLEDSVSIYEKDSARFLVYHALKTFDYGNVEVLVRINSLQDGGLADLYRLARQLFVFPRQRHRKMFLPVNRKLPKLKKSMGWKSEVLV